MKTALITITLVTIIASMLPPMRTKTSYYKYDEMIKEIERIEIIDIKSIAIDKAGRIKKIKEFDYTVIKTFEYEELHELLLNLSEIKCVTYYDGIFYRDPQGLMLKIYYKNSNYDFINYNTWIWFDKNGKWIDGASVECPEEVFNAFIIKFIATDAQPEHPQDEIK